jgi:hypothetical protein
MIFNADEDDHCFFAPSISDLLARMIAEWQSGRMTFESGDDGDRYYDLSMLRGEFS